MKRIVATAVVGLIILVSMSASPLQAGPPTDSEAAAGELDAESFAATEGIGFDEAQRRLLERRELDPAIEFIASNRSTFGGAFIDQDAGGILDIAVASHMQEMRASLSKLLPSDASVRWRTVERSLSDLDGVRDALIARVEDLEQAGSPLASVAVDVPRNAVVLTLVGPTAELEESLSQEFGSAVEVESGSMPTSVACTNRSSCDPWRGGIKILPGDGGGLQCTYGYNVRSQSSGTKYMMTAGHCDNENWRHDGYSIGTTNLNNLLTSGSVLGDFQRVPTFLASPMNLIYASDTDKSRSMTAIRTYANQIVGDYVCASGVTNGYRCGSIVDDDYYYGIIFRGQTKYMWGKLAGSTADPLRSDEGDSGGPVFLGATAYGIVSARDGDTKTAYGVVDLAMDALGIRLCLSSLCP